MIELTSSEIDDNGIVAKLVINGVIPAFISTNLGNMVKSVGASSLKKWNTPSPRSFIIELTSSGIDDDGSSEKSLINGIMLTPISGNIFIFDVFTSSIALKNSSKPSATFIKFLESLVFILGNERDNPFNNLVKPPVILSMEVIVVGFTLSKTLIKSPNPSLTISILSPKSSVMLLRNPPKFKLLRISSDSTFKSTEPNLSINPMS